MLYVFHITLNVSTMWRISITLIMMCAKTECGIWDVGFIGFMLGDVRYRDGSTDGKCWRRGYILRKVFVILLSESLCIIKMYGLVEDNISSFYYKRFLKLFKDTKEDSINTVQNIQVANLKA